MQCERKIAQNPNIFLLTVVILVTGKSHGRVENIEFKGLMAVKHGEANEKAFM